MPSQFEATGNFQQIQDKEKYTHKHLTVFFDTHVVLIIKVLYIGFLSIDR